MAEKEGGNKVSVQTESSTVPDVPSFSITYLGESLVCSPTGLIKTKTHKDLVTYQCQNKYADNKGEKLQDEARGNDETKRMRNEIRNKMAQGAVYSVQIPLYDANSLTMAKLIATRQLNNSPY